MGPISATSWPVFPFARWPRFPQAILFTAIAVALFASDPAQASETLLLEVSVNDQALDGIVMAERLDDGQLALPAEVWSQARLKLAAAPRVLPDGRTVYALESIPGLTYNLDMASLKLSVIAPATAFQSSQHDLRDGGRPTPEKSPPGIYLDYDLSFTQALSGGNNRGALIEAVAFKGGGSVVSGMAWHADASGSNAFRTDTYWRRDLPASMTTLVIGDAVSSAGSWSRPVRYGGVRFARDFGTAPGYITYPIPSISGSAALPSTVDVLVNSRRGATSTVDPGPFELTNVPIVNGAGEIELVVRDLLGRETRLSQSFYVAPRLLAPGLSDFSFDAGKMREGFGSDGDHYARAFAALTYRRGLSDWVTAEVRTESEPDRRAAGMAITAVVAKLGVLELAGGWSIADGKRGGHYVASAQRIGSRGGATVQWSHFDDDYREFGALDGEHHPKGDFSTTAGARFGASMSGGLSYTRRTEWDGKKFSLLGANLGMQMPGNGFLSLNLSRRMDGDRGWSGMLNFIMPLGRRRTVAASSTRQVNGRVVNALEASQSTPPGPGWGWRVRASDSASQRLEAGAMFNGNGGQVNLETSVGGNNDAVRIGAIGSVGRLKGLSFASRRIGTGAFAVVKVGDFPGVEISLSNQAAATTNRKGMAMVTGLLPYQRNQLSLDSDQLPLDADIGGVKASSVPYARSGTFIQFPVRRSRDVLVVLLQSDGSPIPPGARVTTSLGLAEFTVALRGETYLTGVSDDQRLKVQWPGGACSVTLHLGSMRPGSFVPAPLTCGGPR